MVRRPLICCEFRQLKLVAGIAEWAVLRAPDESGGAREWQSGVNLTAGWEPHCLGQQVLGEKTARSLRKG